MHEELDKLSQAGQARFALMLSELTTAMHRHQRRQRIRSRSIVIAGVALLITAGGAVSFSLLPFNTQNSTPTNIAQRLPEQANPPTDSAHSLFAVKRIGTDPTVLSRWSVHPASTAVQLDDEGLVQTLREIDRPSGIIRIEGRIWLTHAVTDPIPPVEPDQS